MALEIRWNLVGPFTQLPWMGYSNERLNTYPYQEF